MEKEQMIGFDLASEEVEELHKNYCDPSINWAALETNQEPEPEEVEEEIEIKFLKVYPSNKAITKQIAFRSKLKSMSQHKRQYDEFCRKNAQKVTYNKQFFLELNELNKARRLKNSTNYVVEVTIDAR